MRRVGAERPIRERREKTATDSEQCRPVAAKISRIVQLPASQTAQKRGFSQQATETLRRGRPHSIIYEHDRSRKTSQMRNPPIIGHRS